ncbi:Mechanosensitive ion channel protein 2, chloroplastic [Heracleum sosnowskyi]|uniref:Mechanosensitive ion channel protein 2, chloroplastic n=1 Tax=Heracleum sosnowskyi TaxID=360622 RepID=A0AAD8HPB1_9APIA|nr:Mechanosensitive ion channel protein 2, chloroplastic [Heracleum sosnowskyi]
MGTGCTLQVSPQLGMYRNHPSSRELQQSWLGSGRVKLAGALSTISLRQDSWSAHFSEKLHRRVHAAPYRRNLFTCHSFLNLGHSHHISSLKNAAAELTRSCGALQGKHVVLKLVPAVTVLLFAVWGLGPLIRLSRNIILHKSDKSWKKSGTNYVVMSYLQPILLWTGATLICRALDPVVLPSEASEIVKQRLLNFVRSLSTVLAFAYCISSVIQQTQKYFTETSDSADSRNVGFQFAGKAVYSAVWVAAVSLFMELLGFSTQKWLTAGGLGTVLLTLAGREIFTNFLSSVMIQATRPFVVSEWIKTKIEGYEVSGTVEHVGWWSPTIIRGDDREAIYIPNQKFTVNVVRNITQKSHWRIKTHLAISHLDVNKINNIVADMRKVLAKNPQVEQQKLHRRVFLENVNPENQALMILISCFVKTSRFEEYLCVKEAILLDLLRVISHHRARLATPIRTVQKIYGDADLDSMPFSDSVFTHGRAPADRPLLLIEPSNKINGEGRTKSQTRSSRTNGEQDNKAAARTSDNQMDVKGGPSDAKTKEKSSSDSKEKEASLSVMKENSTVGVSPNPDIKKDQKIERVPEYDTKQGEKDVDKILSKSTGNAVSKAGEVLRSNSTAPVSNNVTENNSTKKQPKNGKLESAAQNIAVENTSSAVPKTASNKASSSTSNPKQAERLTDMKVPASRPVSEENIVLGVALDGSKRTLPIDEGMPPFATSTEDKELATSRSKSVSPTIDKDKKDNQNSTVPGATPADK